MEQAKISGYQLFVLIFLFLIGSAIWVPLATEAKQAAWLAVLIGTLVGLLLFGMYYTLYRYYPDQVLTEYIQDLTGGIVGRILVFLYIVYFIYNAARVLRDFGETLLTFAYPNIPLFVANAVFILVIMYAVRKGIEVLARTGELLFFLENLLFIIFVLLVVITGMIDFSNFRPLLENGALNIAKAGLLENSFFPFGEVFVFTMIFPYLKSSSNLMKIGIGAVFGVGLFLAFVTALNISVLGVHLIERSQFPFLTLIQSIELADFIERLDVYFLLKVILGSFLKVSIYTYAAVMGTTNLIKFKEPSQLAYPIAIVILLVSIIIASSYTEHIKEGLEVVPIFVHFPFQVIIPALLLLIAFIKHGKLKSKRGQTPAKGMEKGAEQS